MPLRAALNVVYAMQVKGMDAKEREQFDADLHGWTRVNERANRALFGGVPDISGSQG